MPTTRDPRRPIAAPGVDPSAYAGAPTQATPPTPPGLHPVIPPTAPTGDDAAGGTGFLNLSRILGVNADQGAKMGGALAAGVEGEGKAVQGREQEGYSKVLAGGGSIEDYDKGLGAEADRVGEEAKQLTSNSGRAAALEKKNAGEGGYDSGKSGFDALVAGAGGGGKQLDAVSSAYQGLAQQLGVANAKAQGVHQHFDDVAKQQQEKADASAHQHQVDDAMAAAEDMRVKAGGIGLAANDDPDRMWGDLALEKWGRQGTDPIWNSITKDEASQIQNAHDTMSPAGYRDWLGQLKKTLKKRQGH